MKGRPQKCSRPFLVGDVKCVPVECGEIGLKWKASWPTQNTAIGKNIASFAAGVNGYEFKAIDVSQRAIFLWIVGGMTFISGELLEGISVNNDSFRPSNNIRPSTYYLQGLVEWVSRIYVKVDGYIWNSLISIPTATGINANSEK